MRLYGAIEKVVPLEDGTVRVHGIASTEAMDDQSEVVKADAMRLAIPEYMRFPALREMHQLSAAGTTLEVAVGDDAVTRIVAHVVDPVAVSKVKNQVYRGFSIGGRVTKREAGNNKVITGLMLSEISLVDRPANPEAVFDCWKAAGAPPGEEFMESSQTAAAAPFNAPIQVWACGHPLHRHIAKSEALKCMQTPATPDGGLVLSPDEAEKHLEKQATSSAGDDIRPDDAAPPDPEAEKAEIEKNAADGATSAQALMDAALAAVENGEAALAKTEPEVAIAKDGDMEMAEKDGDMEMASDKPYGDVSYADSGHQSDGKKRYPIDTEAHIRAAWNYINKPKNAGKYDAKDLASIKSKIVAAWKSKIDKDGPPSASKKTTQADLAKSLWDIGEVAMLIAGLRAMCERLELERAMEGDDSALPESCEAVCASACALLMAMCAEETQEVLADTEIMGPVGPAMNEMMLSAIATSLAKAIPDTAKVDQLMETLGKANARHSAPHQAQLDVAAYAIHKGMEVGGLKRAEMASGAKAHKAVLDAGATALNADGREMLTDGNPTQGAGAATEHATTDTGRNGQTAVPNPTGASPASPYPLSVMGKASTADLDEIDAMVKAGKGASSLFSRAHDLLHDCSEGATCKEDAAKPPHLSAKDMGFLHECHGNLMAIDGVQCAASAVPGGATASAGEPEGQGATTNTVKAADVAQMLAPAAPEQVWAVERVERDDLAKALACERAEKAELVKTIGAIVPMLDRLTKRVDQIAETPMPARSIANTAVIGVTKAQDGAPLGGQAGPGTPLEQRLTPELRAEFAKLSIEEQTMLKIRDQLGQPIAYDPIKRVLSAA